MTTASRQHVSYLAGGNEEREAVGRRSCYSAPAAVIERKKRGQPVPFPALTPDLIPGQQIRVQDSVP